MIIVAVYMLAVLLFCLSFYFARVVETCRKVLSIVRESMGVLTDGNLDDLVKEEAIKEAALSMAKQCIVLLIKILIILGVTVLPMWLAALMGVATLSETSQFAMRWDVLVITTLVILVPVIVLRHKS